MSVAIPFHKHSVGRTFSIALGVLGVGALTQFSAMGWLFLTRYRSLPPEGALVVKGSTGASLPVREFTDPFAENATPAAANLPAATPPPKPTPVPLGAEHHAAEPAPVDRLSELVEQGRLLRERGDTYASVTKLREAETMDDQNPLPTAELAMTYEKMGFAEKAAECWKKIYQIGESAGLYYALAVARQKEAISEATKVSGASSTDSNVPATGMPPLTVPKGETVGLNANCKLGLQEITRTDLTDPANKRHFILKVPVKAKPRVRIDVPDVIVQVVFYDIVNGRALDRTNAQVTYKWASPPADWSDDDVETLEVTYILPEPRVSDEDRNYYGYLVSVYYKNALQDFRSDPVALAQKAPPAAALAQDSLP